MIVLDTSVLSLALRRRRATSEVTHVRARVAEVLAGKQPVAIPGIVLQELLTGVRTDDAFARLHRGLAWLRVLLASEADHLAAARLASGCRRAGVTVFGADALIAAQTMRAGAQLFTLDRDFHAIADHSSLRLLPV